MRNEELKRKMISNSKKRVQRVVPGVNCDVRPVFVDPRSVKVAKNLEVYLERNP